MNLLFLNYHLVFIFIVGFIIGYAVSARDQMNMAIQAKVGRWVVDPSTGKTQFKYGKE